MTDWPGIDELQDAPPNLDLFTGDGDEDEETKACETCGGEGSVLVAAMCRRRISDCCGGCVEPCPDCNAKPEREYDKYE